MPLPPAENPPNPWLSSSVEYLGEPPAAAPEVYEDHSRTILTKNESPDVGFRWSVNPYRGCFHACAYCYARPGHEHLGYGAGTDFETKLVVKPRAPELLRAALLAPSWGGEPIAFSGVTDCYQPLEASYRLTRGCLEVCAEFRNPVCVITKGALVERDLDLLARLHREARVAVAVSVPFFDEAKARAIEPHVPTPARRLKAVARLAAAGLPVGVMVAPIIPGLNDEDLGPLLEAARDAGARWACRGLLRLPGSTREVFTARLERALPLRSKRVLARVREARGGRLNDPRFGARMRGEGHYVEALHALFEAHARRLGLPTHFPDGGDAPSTFRRPPPAGAQLSLFDPPGRS
ncbi:MAG TPA: PA0069 family radical SAM protein [Polyangiaceae bacterium]|nr:PA0069 family radical SAM protein [Polyangiaceae bacterium]